MLYFPSAMPANATNPQPPAQHGAILLVEDDSSIRAVFSTSLEQHGFTILKAKNADEALEICSHYREPIDLLLADLMLPPKVRLSREKKDKPPVHGVELMRRITKMRPGIRVILFS